MKCQKCSNEATVHEVMIRGGERHEKHLCEHCAASEGVGPTPQAIPLDKLILENIVGIQPLQTTPVTGAGGKGVQGPGRAAQATHCAACGLGFAHFRNTGMLGCPACYATFEGQLGPMLSRAHEGGTHHVGKTPCSFGDAVGARGAAGNPGHAGQSGHGRAPVPMVDVTERLSVLRKSLEEAIIGEQYEKAAKLRDEMRRVQLQAVQAGGGGVQAAGAEEAHAQAKGAGASAERPKATRRSRPPEKDA